MADVLRIKADDPNVLSLYHKQKLEFHFQQKSDNDFVMFLLDTAMRVISIVQHLSPVLEAVSIGNSEINVTSTNFSVDSSMNMETDQPKLYHQQSNSEEQPDIDLESLSSTSTPPFNVHSLSSALKNFAPTSTTLQTSFNSSVGLLNSPSASATSLQNSPSHSSISVQATSASPQIQNVGSLNSSIQKNDSLQIEPPSLSDFDKTISALQKQLDSVSQSIVSESNKEESNEIAILKRLQENLKEPNPNPELDLIKTLQDTFTNRTKTDDIRIKEELDVMPTVALYKPELDNRQTTERLQQLMNSLQNGSQSSSAIFPPSSGILTPNSSQLAALNSSQMGGSSVTTLTQINPGLSVNSSGLNGSVSPVLKTPQAKKSVNPLSMLHLQGGNNAVDQAAFLSVLYNADRNNSPASPDVKVKSNPRSSPNRFAKMFPELLSQASPLLSHHSNHHHDQVSCHVCGKVFRGSSRAQNLKRHFNNVHLKLKPFRCVVCGMMFGLKYNLKSHMHRAHNIPNGVSNGVLSIKSTSGGHSNSPGSRGTTPNVEH